MPRFFLEELDESDVCITGPDARHIGLALRMRVGEMLTVCAYGRDYQCRIRSITPEEVHLDVVSSELCAAEPSVSLTLYQAGPKRISWSRSFRSPWNWESHESFPC